MISVSIGIYKILSVNVRSDWLKLKFVCFLLYSRLLQAKSELQATLASINGINNYI